MLKATLQRWSFNTNTTCAWPGKYSSKLNEWERASQVFTTAKK